MKIINWSNNGPEKLFIGKDRQAYRVRGQTLTILLRGAFSEDIEAAILWVLTREWKGFYFAFSDFPFPDSSIPKRAIHARTWFTEEEYKGKRAIDLKTRISELLTMAENFSSPSSFLINICNRDMATETVSELFNHDEISVSWITREE